jgi:hypothetical protein
MCRIDEVSSMARSFGVVGGAVVVETPGSVRVHRAYPSLFWRTELANESSAGVP